MMIVQHFTNPVHFIFKVILLIISTIKRVFGHSNNPQIALSPSSYSTTTYRYKRSKSGRIYLAGILFLLLTSSLKAQTATTGDYRSITSGNWTALTTWQYYNGTAWVPATTYPGEIAGTGNVSIVGGNSVTLDITSIPYSFTRLTIGDGIFQSPQYDQLSLPENAGSFAINTINISILDDGTIFWEGKKGDLLLPADGKISFASITNSPVPLTTGKSCNANVTIHYGTTKFASCSGGNATYSFDDLNSTSNNSLTVTTTSNAPICEDSILNLYATATGLGSDNATIEWTGSGPGYSFTPSYIKTDTLNKTNSQTISGLTPGTYTFTATVYNNNSPGYQIFQTISVVVNPKNTISLSSATGTDAQTVCINTAINNITYTTTGATGATISGLPPGVTGSWAFNKVTISGIPTSPGTFNYTITLLGGCSTIPKTGSIMVNLNYWFGTNSTNWNDQGNWGCSIPVSGADVVFAASPINDLELDTDHIIGNLTNNSTKNLIILPGKTLIVNGTVTTNSANRIQIQAAPNTTNGSFIFKNPPATAVQATVQMYTKGFYGSQWTWTDPKGNIFKGYYRWQFFGIPVQSVATASPTFDGSWVREYHESLNMEEYYNKWTQLNNSSSLVAFNGYEITQANPTFITFQGALVTGDRTLTLTRTTSGTLNYGSGYNIFGNSYTAAIDISKINFGPGVDNTVYLYTTGSLADWGTNGALQNSSAGSYYAIPYQTTSVLGNEIPSMQGFLLIATTNGATVTIPYNATTSSATANTTLQRVKQAAPASTDLSYMTADVTGESGSDRVWLFSQPGTTHGFDNGWDGEKIIASNGVTLYAAEEAGNFQVDAVDDINNTYLGFQPGQDTVYTLTFAHHNTENIYNSLYLVDLVENKVTDITSDGSSYTFKTTPTSTSIKRFKIITFPTSVKNDLVDSKIKIFSSGSTIFVQNLTNLDGECIIYDIAGHYLKKIPFSTNWITTIIKSLRPGAYIVTAITGNQRVSKRLLIQ